MTWPEPTPGLVVRYSYLWRAESSAGRLDGVKDRPCAVILAQQIVAGQREVTVLPISHSAPTGLHAVEIPPATKQRLGLDVDRSWIVLTEANRFIWPGPDLRLLPGLGPETSAYGVLPEKLMRVVRTRFVEAIRAGRVKLVPRGD